MRSCCFRAGGYFTASVFDVHTLLYAFVAILLGFQLLTFATFTKVFAITEGLLPEDPRLNRMFRWVTLETGLLAGGLLILLGVGGSLFAVSGWARESFGALDTSTPCASLCLLSSLSPWACRSPSAASS